MKDAASQGGAVLIDGAQFDQALVWLYQQYSSHQPMPLLSTTPYAPLAEVGPILLEAPLGSPLHRDWWRGDEAFQHAVWLDIELPIGQVFTSLQRRLRVRSPDGREFWLRMADARPLRHAWLAGANWPDGFWHGVRGLWLRHDSAAVCAWHNPAPEWDCVPTGIGSNAQATLDWPLLEALTTDMDSPQEAV